MYLYSLQMKGDSQKKIFFAEPLPSNDGGKHIQKHTLIEEIYKVRR
jgi:hypothetical protein